MLRKLNEKERTMDMQKNKIILQLTRLLEHQNLITSSERMKMTDIIRKGQ